MLVPLSWLKEYVDIDVEAKELEEKLFSCGFEVEESYEVGKDISGVVVGLVEECEPIPETHLHVCKVNVGGAEPLQICCGADNVHAGGKYPVALEGAQVYATAKDHVTIEGTMKIKKGKLRGYESCGMLCSGTELGLNEDLYPGAGNNGLLVLPEDAEVGADVKPLLQLDDWIFDIAITANRPDCESIHGYGKSVLGNAALSIIQCRSLHRLIQDRRYFSGNTEDALAWMKRRLALVGIGSISNVVDITNYILKELGQPMHAFDSSYIEGNAIHVRRAHDKEKIMTLDEKEFELNENNLVICDGVKPVALAGIMGGLNSEIRDTTEAVIFESAKFARDNIRKSSRALGQSSDSSQRYAKGVDEYATVMASKRALHLIEELGCGKVSSTHVEVSTGNSIEPAEMKASIKKVNGVLGIEVPTADIERILKSLNFQPVINGDELTIQVPAYREDMESYPDIAEEVIRMYGYDHETPTFLAAAAVTSGGMNTKQTTVLLVTGNGMDHLGQLTYEIQKEEDMRESAYIAEIDLKALRPVYGKVPTFAPISRFAKETRDLALVMSKSVTCGEVEKAIAEASSFVESVELFDVYEGLQVGPEKKSMAFTVTFAPKEEEFTTEAVDGYVKKILKNLNNKLGVELRS